MPQPERGRIVWVELPDPQGQNPKCRPVVILTAAEEIKSGEPMVGEIDGAFPDAWMFSTIPWPRGSDEKTQRAFFDDLVAEVETMADGVDRCRWEFDDPYGYRH